MPKPRLRHSLLSLSTELPRHLEILKSAEALESAVLVLVQCLFDVGAVDGQSSLTCQGLSS